MEVLLQGLSAFELEGIDVWDLDGVSNSHLRSVGQIHLTVFNADLVTTDNMYILNWQVSRSKSGFI